MVVHLFPAYITGIRRKEPFMKKYVPTALILFGVFFVMSCASAPTTAHIPAVERIDFDLFEAPWYEIARIPIPIASDWVGTTDTYVRQEDGSWIVLYEGYKGDFDGKKGVLTQKLKLVEGDRQGEMKARPFPFIWMPYRIIYWNGENRTMLVTSGSMDYLWIMARDSVLPQEVYEELVAESARLGFDTARLEVVRQRDNGGGM